MKTVFIASDGKQFDDQWECEDYEWILKHPEIKNVRIFDYLTNQIGNIFDFDGYSIATYVHIPKESLVAFEDFAEFTGYSSYEDINEEGWWRFDNKTHRFVKY